MKGHAVALIGICLLTFFAGLGAPAIADSDEAFYAESAREMVELGDWLTPHFNYIYRFEKPILYYWLVAIAYTVGGVSEAAARFPSALAGLGLTLLTFGAARRYFDSPTALLAGLITATSFGCVGFARQALPDLTLAFFIALATWASLVAWMAPTDTDAGGPDPAVRTIWGHRRSPRCRGRVSHQRPRRAGAPRARGSDRFCSGTRGSAGRRYRSDCQTWPSGLASSW